MSNQPIGGYKKIEDIRCAACLISDCEVCTREENASVGVGMITKGILCLTHSQDGKSHQLVQKGASIGSVDINHFYRQMATYISMYNSTKENRAGLLVPEDLEFVVYQEDA